MTKAIVFLSLFLVCGVARASEQYQMTNAVGIWKASWGSGAFEYFDLMITVSQDGKNLDIKHCTLDVELSGQCTAYDGIVGVGTYSQSTDTLQITESNGSPTPAYNVKIDPKDSGVLNRSWGTQTIRYFKLP